MSSGSETQKPSSEKTRTFARERAIAPSSASCSPLSPTVTAPIGLHGGVARRAAEAGLLLDDSGGVGDRERVRHREDRREPARRCGLRAGEHGLALLVARLAQVRVQVDEAGQRHEPVGVDDRRARGIRDATDLGDDAVGEEEVGALARRAGSHR